MPHHAAAPDNLLLAALLPGDRAVVHRFLHPIDLPLGLTLYEPGEPIGHVWFPATGLVSMVSDMEEGTVEVGTVGNEGMAGISVLLHTPAATTRAFMQIAGHGWRCSAEDLYEVMESTPVFHRLLLQYANVLFEQVAQSAACNRLHTLEERCARWLLMVHDRIGDGVLPLKPSFLADMLGVHRPAVTLAASALQAAGLIRYSRGKVQVVDRAGLESVSCACYQVVRASSDRLRASASPPVAAPR